MIRLTAIAIVVLVAGVFVHELAAAAKQLRLSVRPGAFAFAPADVEIRMHVEPGGRGREVLLELDGPGFYSSSLKHIPSDPDAPTVQNPTWYRSIPPGQYVVVATLTDCAPGGCGHRVQLARVEHPLRILGMGEELPQ